MQQTIAIFSEVFVHFLFSPLVWLIALPGAVSLAGKPLELEAKHVLFSLGLFTGFGLIIIACGFWSVNGQTSETPSYLHGMACVYAFASAFFIAVAVWYTCARQIRQRWRGLNG